MKKVWVYISGPISKGDHGANIRAGLDAGEEILRRGHVPIVPHMSTFWNVVYPKPWEAWIDYDLELLTKCDILWRLPGESKGADMEVVHANHNFVRVTFSLEETLIAIQELL